MRGQTLELWQRLCELAAREQDPDHLMELIRTINRLLDEKTDDSRTVRHRLHGLLERHLGWKVCADAVDGSDGIAKAQQFKPDVIVLDFFMPGMTGVEVARILKRVLPSVPIVIVTFEITAQLVEQSKSVG